MHEALHSQFDLQSVLRGRRTVLRGRSLREILIYVCTGREQKYMNILTVENITKAYGERKLFDNASFYLQEGEKVGVIGINGTGKSTLLKIMAGLEEPDTGNVVNANHVITRYLHQHPVFDAEDTVLEAVKKDCLKEKGSAAAGSGSIETEAKSMLTKLGVTDFYSRCGVLSGGQKKRLALVAALLAPADILILDEPTNHLDNEMAEWLENMLRKRTGTVVMVTHDRYFLDSVSSRMIEIDKGQIYSYQTNYSGFVGLKAKREAAALAGERRRQSVLRKELEWVRRGAQARSTKQKARLERFEELKEMQAPAADGRVELNSAASRLGKTTIEIDRVSKAYDDKVLINNFSYIFLKNDRIGFVGPNGCGKTTLMRILIGEVLPDSGCLEIGQTVKIGYYSQEIAADEMPSGTKVIDYIRSVAEYVKTAEGSITASQMLERFLFEGSEQYSFIDKLSGGEKRRLNLLKVLMGAPNVLILDEPTNDLDISTLTVLEDYLDHFPGIVITVSHDRYFLDRTVRRIFAFGENGNILQYEGGYTDYTLRKEMEIRKAGDIEEKTGKSLKVNAQKSWKTQPAKLKFTFQEQKDYDIIEAEISRLEEHIDELEKQILKAATDFIKLNQLTKEKEDREKKLEERMERWMYLEELKSKIDNQ